jgi:hypothetical protein
MRTAQTYDSRHSKEIPAIGSKPILFYVLAQADISNIAVRLIGANT